MPQFVYVYRGGSAGTPDEMKSHVEQWLAWMQGLVAAGRVKNHGAGLVREGGRVARADRVTDGPYAEKDIVGGFLVVEAADWDEAERLAERCPILAMGGAIEIRRGAEGLAEFPKIFGG